MERRIKIKKALVLFVSLCFVFSHLFIISYSENPMNNQQFAQVSEAELSTNRKALERNLEDVLYKLYKIFDYSRIESGEFTVTKVIDGVTFKDVRNLESFLQMLFDNEDYYFFTQNGYDPKLKCYINPIVMRQLSALYYDLYKLYK